MRIPSLSLAAITFLLDVFQELQFVVLPIDLAAEIVSNLLLGGIVHVERLVECVH